MKSRLVVVLIFLVAVVMGGYGWWYNFQQGRRSLRLWGSDAAVLIRYAPQVVLLQLELARPDERASERLDIDSQRFAIVRQFEISKVPGLVHARHALIEDASFVWSARQRACQPNWQFALRFLRGPQRATLAFDTNCDQVRLIEHNRTARLLDEPMRAFDRKRQVWAAMQ